jgi:type IV pilus assembly protein PilC
MKFTVRVKKSDGTEEIRAIEAETRFAIYGMLEKTGETAVSIEEGSGMVLPAWTQITIGSGVKIEQRIAFTKNLSAMLNAGLPLTRALSVIERQSVNKVLKKIIIEIEDRIRSGTSLHDALAEHPKVFPKLFIAMTKAGEEGGTLSQSLTTVARQMDRSNTLTKKVKGAMIYPSIILFAIGIIGILMLLFVVPTLAATFGQLGAKLPLATQIILNMSNFMTSHYVVVLIGIFIVIVGGKLGFRTKQGGAALLFAARHMPVIGELVLETFSARAARTLASLLSSGVEMLNALTITEEVVGDNVFGHVVGEAAERVKKGEQLSAAFLAYPKLYPVFYSDMIAVGEETGNVSEMLTQVSEYYETDVEDRTKDLSTIIEPILMLFIGLFVGVFAISMIAPIYSLSSSV